jgi:predicted Fe-Mo cluster-binding NifX family protein
MTAPIKIAVPVQNDRISGHFGHPEYFSFVSVDPAKRQVVDEERLTPPPHEPGLLPVWLSQQGADVVLAGGIGPRAVNLLESRGIEVCTGVPPLAASEAVRLWLEGSLETAGNTCNHGEPDHHHRCGGHE